MVYIYAKIYILLIGKNIMEGYKKKDSFIEYSKNFIDMLNYYHIRQDLGKYKPIYEKFRKTIKSVHYYDSVIVLEKRKGDFT